MVLVWLSDPILPQCHRRREYLAHDDAAHEIVAAESEPETVKPYRGRFFLYGITHRHPGTGDTLLCGRFCSVDHGRLFSIYVNGWFRS